MAADPRLAGRSRQRLAFGDAQLQLHQVQTGDLLGDRVLDLEPGVHLQEVKAPVTVQHELDGARSGVADRPAGRDGRGGQRVAKVIVDGRRRALLHDLLVAALDRALALEQVDHIAVGVTEDLDLDVPGVGDEPLQEHGAVAERGGRLAARAAHRLGQLRRVGDQPHTAAAAAKGRLDQQREANGRARGGNLVQVGGVGDGGAGQDGHVRLRHDRLRPYLVAHRLDGLGPGTDKGQPRVGAGPCEPGVLREEPVAGVDRVRAGGRGRGDDQVAAQVGVGGRRAGQPDRLVGQRDVGRGGVRVGVDRDGGDAERVRGPYDPGRDLAAVGDQELGNSGHPHHIRKTPKPRRPATGPLCTADRDMPRTVLVSRGSMMPSS